MLTRKAVVESKTTFAIEKVPLPAWAQICGVAPAESYLYARTLGAERAGDVQRISEAQQKAMGDEAQALAFAQWAVLGACDEQGKAFFTEADIPALLKRPLMPLVELASVTMRLNGVTADKPTEKEGTASSGAPKEG